MNTSSRLRPTRSYNIGNSLVESFLDLDRSSLVQGELDDQRIRASLDSEIRWIDEQGVPGVLGNHLEGRLRTVRPYKPL